MHWWTNTCWECKSLAVGACVWRVRAWWSITLPTAKHQESQLNLCRDSRARHCGLRLELSPHIALIVYPILKTELASCSFDEDIRESNIFGPQGTVK